MGAPASLSLKVNAGSAAGEVARVQPITLRMSNLVPEEAAGE